MCQARWLFQGGLDTERWGEFVLLPCNEINTFFTYVHFTKEINDKGFGLWIPLLILFFILATLCSFRKWNGLFPTQRVFFLNKNQCVLYWVIKKSSRYSSILINFSWTGTSTYPKAINGEKMTLISTPISAYLLTKGISSFQMTVI